MVADSKVGRQTESTVEQVECGSGAGSFSEKLKFLYKIMDEKGRSGSGVTGTRAGVNIDVSMRWDILPDFVSSWHLFCNYR